MITHSLFYFCYFKNKDNCIIKFIFFKFKNNNPTCLSCCYNKQNPKITIKTPQLFAVTFYGVLIKQVTPFCGGNTRAVLTHYPKLTLCTAQWPAHWAWNMKRGKVGITACTVTGMHPAIQPRKTEGFLQVTDYQLYKCSFLNVVLGLTTGQLGNFQNLKKSRAWLK